MGKAFQAEGTACAKALEQKEQGGGPSGWSRVSEGERGRRGGQGGDRAGRAGPWGGLGLLPQEGGRDPGGLWAERGRATLPLGVETWKQVGRGAATREDALPGQAMTGLRPQAGGNGERQAGSGFLVNVLTCSKMCVTF